MAYQLVAEVLDHAPPDLTAAELVVLIALAEKMPRRQDYDYEVRHLCRRTRLQERGLRAVVARLKRRGVDIRVPVMKDRNGNPVYAAYGQSTRWRLPVFEPPAGCRCDECGKLSTGGGTTVPPTSGGGTTAASEGRSATTPRHHSGERGSLNVPRSDATVPPTPSVRQDEDGEDAQPPAASSPLKPKCSHGWLLAERRTDGKLSCPACRQGIAA